MGDVQQPNYTEEQERLTHVLNVQSKSHADTRMANYIIDFVGKHDMLANVLIEQDNGNIYLTRGTAGPYPCVVAHMDTVHAIVPDDEYTVYYDRGHLFAWNDKHSRWTGVGGDDKVGIWIALEALLKYSTIKIAFFRDEEIGCQGSRLARMDWFDDVSLVLQADRRGIGDFVQKIGGTKLHGDQFAAAVKPLLEKYKFTPNQYGGMTDVQELRENGLAVASANLSCGYYNPHTAREFIIIEEAERARSLMFDIIAELGHEMWPWIKAKKADGGTSATKPNRLTKLDVEEYLTDKFETFMWEQEECISCRGDMVWIRLKKDAKNFEDYGLMCQQCGRTDQQVIEDALAAIKATALVPDVSHPLPGPELSLLS